MSTFNKPIACQQPVKTQDNEGTGCTDSEPDGTYRGNGMPLKEEGNDPTADHRADDSHRHRCDGTTRVGAGHDGLGQQSDNGSEPDPDEKQVRGVLQVFHHLHIKIHDSLLQQRGWGYFPSVSATVPAGV